MDTFGILPNDVLDKIKHIYQLPKIDIVDKGDQYIFLTLDLHYINLNITLLPPLHNIYGVDTCCIQELLTLNTFINALRENKPSYYDENGSFKITYNKNININYYGATLKLNKNCLPVLIKALEKYYNILNSYPKI
jgi:hypothetical protein